MSMHWYDQYIGRPWAAVPNPPDTFTCGELGRYILKRHCGIDVPEIVADPQRLRSCVDAMTRDYGLVELPECGERREFDIVYFVRVARRDHVGIAVVTPGGIKILHCQRGAGVTVDSPGELKGIGVRKFIWCRHRSLM